MDPDDNETDPGPAWVQPPRSPARTVPAPVRAVIGALSVLIGAGLLYAIYRVALKSSTNAGAEGYAAGVATGSALLALAIGFGLRWLYLRSRAHAGTIRSVWVLLVASLVLALSFSGQVLSAQPTLGSQATLDPGVWLKDASPYTLVPLTAAQSEGFDIAAASNVAQGRQVMSNGALVGIVVVTAGGITDSTAALKQFATSVSGSADGGQNMTVSGHPAVLLSAASGASMAFVDGTSYMVAVVAQDAATAMSIATALSAHGP